MSQDYKILHSYSVGSTNDLAEATLSREAVDEFTVFFADYQTNGKGIGHNIWESNMGENLLISIVLHPVFLNPADQFMINKIVSLGVCKCLDKYIIGQRITIKWPNDVWVGFGKIAGILSRNLIMGNRFETCIVGIGLNINQQNFSPEIPNPVSMYQIAHRAFDRNEVLKQLIDDVKHFYSLLKKNLIEAINQYYLERLLFYNTSATFIADDQEFTGIIKGVDEFGLLLVEVEENVRRYNIKDISLKVH